MQAIHISQFGEKLTAKTIPKPVPTESQVLVQMKYSPINPSDIYWASGMYGFDKSVPRGIGFEGSGIVVETGDDAYAKTLLGKSVSCVGVGAWAEYLLCDAKMCVAHGENLPDEDYQKICSSFVNPLSAQLMVYLAKKLNHPCIVQSAARSALGCILVRIAKKKGIKTISIVRKEEQINELIQMGGDYVLNSSDPNFEENLKAVIEKENPLSFYDAIGGETFGHIFTHMPVNSISYSYGILSLKSIAEIDPSHLIFKNKTIKGFWLTSLLNEIPSEDIIPLIQEIAASIKDDCSSKIHKIYNMDQVDEAIAEYNQNMSAGKVLISLSK